MPAEHVASKAVTAGKGETEKGHRLSIHAAPRQSSHDPNLTARMGGKHWEACGNVVTASCRYLYYICTLLERLSVRVNRGHTTINSGAGSLIQLSDSKTHILATALYCPIMKSPLL